MTASRFRMWALVAFAMTALAFSVHAGDLDLRTVPADTVSVAQPAAPTDIGTADGWCALRKPHTGDTIHYAEWYHLSQYSATANCIATHGGVFHFYRVTVWDQDHDGVIELVQWTPLGPWWT